MQGVASNQRFVDVSGPLGLSMGNDNACWVDVDNDGWTDLVAGGIVWRNDKAKAFSQIGDVGSVVAADFDDDGFPDLFSFSRMKLYRNEAGKRFSEVRLPELAPTVSRGACWADVNRDGFVDLFVGGFEDWDKQITYPSYLLLNERGSGFKKAWTDAAFRTRGVTACDFNRSGVPSVYVSNYRLQPNNLWIGDGSGQTRDGAPELNAIATSEGFPGGHSIGACWGDFDNDGEFDLFAGNFAHRDSRGDQPKSRFLRNKGPKAGFHFEDLGTGGVFYQESYASPAAADFDHDGKLDLFFTTVYGTASFKTPNFPVLFRNAGGFAFVDATADLGLGNLPPTYQAAWADYDNDGDLDLATAGKLFQNRRPPRAWLKVKVEGDGRKVDRSAIATQVKVAVSGSKFSRQVEAGTGEGNQNDLTLHFGLGAVTGLVSIEVRWLNGRITHLERVEPNRLVTVRM